NYAKRCSHPFTTTEEELDWPDVAGNDREHRDNHDTIVTGEIARCPNCEHAFKEVADQRDHKPCPTHQAANIFSADTTAPEIAEVLAGSHSNQVIACSKTTKKICP